MKVVTEVSMELQSIAPSLNQFLTYNTTNLGLQVTSYPWILNFSDESIRNRQWTYLWSLNFCLIEVKAMVVAVQQRSAECTAIFTVCIV